MGVYIWSRLPSEYQEVEYIQSSGTQYIKTGYVPNQKTKAEFKISNWNVPVTSPTTYSNIFGADQSYLNRGFNICSTGSSSVYAFGSTGGLINGYTGLNGSGTHIGEYSQSGLYVDGSLVVTPSSQTFTGVNLYLFALNRNGTLTEPASFRMYYFKIYDNGTLVRDFVPCYRKSDSVIGLYDLVNNTFYTNSGTGTFTKGPDVVMTELKNAYIGEYDFAKYQEVEYILNSSGEYIDTGFVPNSNTRVKCKVMVTGYTSGQDNGGIYGVWLNWSGNTRFNLWHWSSSGYGFGYGNNNGSSYCVNVPLNTITEADNYISNGTVYNIINGTTTTYSGASFTGTTGNIYLFRRNIGGGQRDIGIAYTRFYYMKIYDNGTLVRDFIPCYRKSDTEIGLYDLVNNQFYTNSGSGTFSKGSDVVLCELQNAYIGNGLS